MKKGEMTSKRIVDYLLNLFLVQFLFMIQILFH